MMEPQVVNIVSSFFIWIFLNTTARLGIYVYFNRMDDTVPMSETDPYRLPGVRGRSVNLPRRRQNAV